MKDTRIYLDRRRCAAAPSIALTSSPASTVLGTSTLAGLVLFAAAAAASAALAAGVPAAVSAEGKIEFLKLHAEGVQIYECKPDQAGGSKWQFREPLATLLKDGKTVGRHFAGPSWELASGSAVVGKVEAQVPGPTLNDIAQLRLSVAEKRGAGEFDNVTTVQRLDTEGGMFSGSCDMPGMFHLEPYAAEYVFLGD